MLNILFWNLQKKPLLSQLVALVHMHNVDIVALAESNLDISEVLTQLNKNVVEYYYAPSRVPKYDKIQVFTKFESGYIESLNDENRYSIRHLNLPDKPDILIAMVHLRSRLRSDRDDQQLGAQKLVNSIQRMEEQIGHDRTILLGDLNMNPFDPGVVNAGTGLHAVMSRKVAKKLDRTIDGQSYKFFYNPMWRLMGDETDLMPGTYYYTGSTAQEYFWYTFDQILLRPSIIDLLPTDQPKIISEVKGESLLNRNGIPDKNRASDHLPIFASLEF